MSTWLRESAATGDRVQLQAPLGGFALDRHAGRQVFVAGGTGLAPILAMLHAARDEPTPKLLCFGCSAPEHLFLLDELRALERESANLEVRIALMDGATPGTRSGHAVSLLVPEDMTPDTSFHMCGPPAMIDSARKVLREAGIAPRRIRAERFLASG